MYYIILSGEIHLYNIRYVVIRKMFSTLRIGWVRMYFIQYHRQPHKKVSLKAFSNIRLNYSELFWWMMSFHVFYSALLKELHRKRNSQRESNSCYITWIQFTLYKSNLLTSLVLSNMHIITGKKLDNSTQSWYISSGDHLKNIMYFLTLMTDTPKVNTII